MKIINKKRKGYLLKRNKCEGRELKICFSENEQLIMHVQVKWQDVACYFVKKNNHNKNRQNR